MLPLLDQHLAERPYLFGGRPAFGDFGLWGQIYEMWTDPTAGALIGGGAPHVLDWVHRMLWPKAEGKFEAWSTLQPTLMPILTKQIGAQFMPWPRAKSQSPARSAPRPAPAPLPATPPIPTTSNACSAWSSARSGCRTSSSTMPAEGRAARSPIW